MTDLIGLAERCERAAGPLRELEMDIHDAILGRDHTPNSFQTDGSRIARYTASLDAAMTLVPEGLVWSLNTFGNPSKASAYVMNEQGEQWRCNDYPATPALALCAAAMRARATKDINHG
jgi:hypothetical protein